MDQLYRLVESLTQVDQELLGKLSDGWIGIEKPGHCASIVYTSGTTGKGKGVLLSHDNYSYLAQILVKTLAPELADPILASMQDLEKKPVSVNKTPLDHQTPTSLQKSSDKNNEKSVDNINLGEVVPSFSFSVNKNLLNTKPKGTDEKVYRILSYLPMSHIAAQFFDVVASVGIRSTVYFADPEALKGQKLLFYLQSVRPTHFFSVPRVYEKMRDSVLNQLESSNFIRKNLVNSAFKVGLQNFHNHMTDKSKLGWKFKMYQKLIFQKLKVKMGLDKCLYFIYGAAPMLKEVREFFASFGVYLNNIYGMSETTGGFVGTDMSKPHEYTLQAVGRSFPGLELKIQPNTNEILFKGRSCFMGYLNNFNETIKAIDKRRYVHSGDLGQIDEYGQLWITGRIKELIVTAGGENIAPNAIEDELKKELGNIFWQIIVIGDQRKFISALFFLKNKNDPTQVPGEELDPAVVDELLKLKIKAKTYSDILNNPSNYRILQTYVEEKVEKANKNLVSRAAKVRKFVIPHSDISIALNDMTPTLKIKRPKVEQRFKPEIEKIYMNISL
jgi:long-chain-fatty-acid--CoA ligase ACSBG